MSQKHLYAFGPFQFDAVSKLLMRGGNVVPIAPKLAEILLVLVRHHGTLVEKTEMMQTVWPDTFVEEANLTQSIFSLRKLLGEVPGEPRVIETVPKRGYLFVAPVKEFWEDEPQPATASAQVRWRRKALLAGLAGLLVLAGVLAVIGLRTKSKEGLLTPVPLTSYPGCETQPVFSPDGNQIAFSWNPDGNSDIFVKMIGSETPLRLTKNSADDFSPAWSPDGRWIAFGRNLETGRTGVYLIPSIGGAEREIAKLEAPTSGSPLIAWSHDGKWLAMPNHPSFGGSRGLALLSPETGELRRLTTPPAGWLGDGSPAFSPDGRTLVFSRAVTFSVADLYILRLSASYGAEGSPERLTSLGDWAAGPVWLPNGREIVFYDGKWYGGPSALWRMPVFRGSKPTRLDFAGESAGTPTVSRNGRLVYAQTNSYQVNIWRVQLSSTDQPANPPTPLIASSRMDHNPQFSPDGIRIAFSSSRSGRSEIWRCDRDGSNAEQLTRFGAPITGSPRWSPDGQKIVFDSNRDGRFDLYLLDPAGGVPRRLTNGPADNAVGSWSRDGKWIYFVSNRTGTWQVWKIAAAGGRAGQVTTRGGYVAFESLDGKYLYYSRLGGVRSGADGIYRIPTSGGSEERMVPSVTFQNFAVSKHGIYFIPRPDEDGRFHIQLLDFETGATRRVLQLNRGLSEGVAVSPDGYTLLYTQQGELETDLMLVENFR
jgi:Tol biopolymer transport system component/DNA-binding winged helix-turn-helix (wHTH) protein